MVRRNEVSFRVTRDLANHELVVILWCTGQAKVDRGDKRERNDADHHGQQHKNVLRE